MLSVLRPSCRDYHRQGYSFSCRIIFILLVIVSLATRCCASWSWSPRQKIDDDPPHSNGWDVPQKRSPEIDEEKRGFSDILPKSLSEIKVTNLLLASDIEGNIHALNRQTGELVWSIVGEGPLVSTIPSNSANKRSALTTSSNASSSLSKETPTVASPAGSIRSIGTNFER